jgi:hypothetical protein
MITVRRNPEDTPQKVVSMFLKRVKKSNLVSRKRKIQILIKPLSHLEKKRKALRKSKYLETQTLVDKIGKTNKF